ncbi:hypothetical protein HK097_001076 [Rhizophlyctis rosea]|uniref:WD40 repeat-like protein n=1 Tax=Rhizophlyctis rosea TaxID=64517 RepID=A0AAD5S4W6_9FUNG|nr:hypothetical protein HK097_001076 [Rhizophlyctis rosea]
MLFHTLPLQTAIRKRELNSRETVRLAAYRDSTRSKPTVGISPELITITASVGTSASTSTTPTREGRVKRDGGGRATGRLLKSHTGCVNALSISHNGNLLASAGDDQHVLLWPLSNLPHPISPTSKYRGHCSNIFSVAFDCTDRFLYSCGNDGMLLQYDVSRSSKAIVAANQGPSFDCTSLSISHDDAAMKVSPHPFQSNVVLTAAWDSTIKLHDFRHPSDRCQAKVRTRGKRYNSVSFNPVCGDLIVSSTSCGEIRLRDLRYLGSSGKDRWVMEYVTRLVRSDGRKSRGVDVSGVGWSPDGRYIGSVPHRWYPTIYDFRHREPVCVLRGEGYKSISTVKSPTFATLSTPNSYTPQLHFLTGSDDFHAYAWRIPPLSEFESQTLFDYSGRISGAEGVGYYCGNGVKCYPPSIDYSFRLRGHRSIVNSVAAHPYQDLVVTAGVEKCVRVFGAYPGLVCDDEGTTTMANRSPVSTLPGQDPSTLVGGGPASGGEGTDEDFGTLVFFDYLLAEDEQKDTLWGVATSAASSSSDDCGSHSSDDSNDGESDADEETRDGQWGDGDERDGGRRVVSDEIIVDSDEELERVVRDEW